MHPKKDLGVFERSQQKVLNKYELEYEESKKNNDKEGMEYWQKKIKEVEQWKPENFPEEDQKKFKEFDEKPPHIETLPGVEGVAGAVKKRKMNISINELRRRKNVRKDVES